MTLVTDLKARTRPSRLAVAQFTARLAGLPDPTKPIPPGVTPERPGNPHDARIELRYPVHPRPRFGEQWGEARHPELFALTAAGGAHHADVLASIAAHADDLRRIPVHSDDDRQPRWINGWLPGLDTAALYAFVHDRNPALYLEVGSGNSTRVARRAVEDGGLRTRIVSIDPEPRAICDSLCDEVIRRPLEDIDLAIFARLDRGDVCFIDNSHCAYQNSDVTVSFLEILPRLAPGVLVGIHDIFLPDDYPAAWADRWYNEQYMLAAFLLGGGGRTTIELPAWFVAHDERHQRSLEPIWAGPAFADVERHGNAFWLQTA
jgi:hypothetical protein